MYLALKYLTYEGDCGRAGLEGDSRDKGKGDPESMTIVKVSINDLLKSEVGPPNGVVIAATKTRERSVTKI